MSDPNPMQPIVKPRLYERLVDRLRDYVEHGQLKAGDRLPSERELAARLGVSRNSVKQALVALEVQGLVETRHGGGTFLLRDRLDAEPLDTLLDRKKRLPAVLDARDGLERKLAELAAVRRTEADLKAITEALKQMESEIAAGEVTGRGDAAFHSAIVVAANSPILERFYQELVDEIAESRLESLSQPGRPLQSLAQHRRIANAIEKSDSALAGRYMSEHIVRVAHTKLLDWQLDV